MKKINLGVLHLLLVTLLCMTGFVIYMRRVEASHTPVQRQLIVYPIPTLLVANNKAIVPVHVRGRVVGFTASASSLGIGSATITLTNDAGTSLASVTLNTLGAAVNGTTTGQVVEVGDHVHLNVTSVSATLVNDAMITVTYEMPAFQ